MYLRRLIIVVILTISLAFLKGWFFDYRYKKRWHWLYFSKIDEAQKGTTNYDIILLGNSRIHTGINPYILDSASGMTSYNFAIGSGDEEEMALISDIYLKKHTPPKFVMIGLDYFLFMKYEILKERFAYLFYLDDDSVYHKMKTSGFPVGLIKTFPFTKYSFFDEYNRTSVFVESGKIKRLFRHNYFKGFINIFPDLNIDTAANNLSVEKDKSFNMAAPKQSINLESVETLLATIRKFKDSGSDVILFYPPKRSKSNNTVFRQLDSIAEKWSALYNLSIFKPDNESPMDPKYFVDDYHVNEPGSERLSIEVAEFIRKKSNPVLQLLR